jgi:hypothetical protein
MMAGAWGAPVVSPKNCRIALRYGPDRVLILGGAISAGPEATAKALQDLYEKYPKLDRPPVIVPERMNAVPAELLQHFKTTPKTAWHIGGRWQIYPGGGPPATVVIEKLVLLSHIGCDCWWDGAIARFVDKSTANRIAGLRASEFLAAPGAGLANVSQIPIVPLGAEYDAEKIRLALLQPARDAIKDGNFGISENSSETEKEGVRELNRRFLTTSQNDIRVRAFRWAAPEREPLLFVLALWYSDNTPVFAGEAIFEESGQLKLLSFEHREAEWMRMAEFRDSAWDFDSLGRFLNAWKIGTQYFFLRQLNGYESGGIALQELNPREGILDTDLALVFGN